MRFARFALVIALMVACTVPEDDIPVSPDAAPAPDAALPYECTGEDTHSRLGQHWPSGSVVEVLDFTGTSNFLVEEAVNAWNATGIPVELIYLNAPEDDSRGKVIVRADPSGQFLGYASVTTDGEIITSGSVAINPSMLGRSDYARRHVACQEIGHTLGLTHIAGKTCMDDCSRFIGTGTTEFADCMNDPESDRPNERDRCQLDLLDEEPGL